MPELIHVADSRRVEDLSTLGPGFHYVLAGKPSYAVSINRRFEIAHARRVTAHLPNRPRFCVKWRPDLVSMGRPLPYDFDPEWILDGVDRNEAGAAWVEWASKGWRIGLHPAVDMDTWQPLIDSSRSLKQMYCSGFTGTPEMLARKEVRISNFVADVRNPEYRRYAVAHAVRVMDENGLDGMLMDAKLGWHSSGSPDRKTPTNEPQHGGVLFPSPYLPGEFEAGYAAILRGLYAEGIRPVMVTRPGRPIDGADLHAWMEDDVKAMVLGEYASA